MRRPFLVYALVAAVLVAALGLSYFSYRNTPSERAVVLDTMRELASEKVIGIQTEIVKAETAMFQRVDLDNLVELKEVLKDSLLRSVLVLDAEGRIMPGGLYTRRAGSEEQIRQFFLTQVVPDLELDEVLLEERRNLHANYGSLPHLFAYTRRLVKGKMFFVVVETDVNYLFARVFPEFFSVRGSHLYQLVDQDGELIYGYAFSGVPEQDVVELPLRETLSRWRLRVAPRDAKLLASRATRRATLDVVLIGVALGIITTGFLVMLFAVRRERRVSELKSEFISNVSHELKTPLSIISMFGELLSMGRARSNEQATEYAEIIRRESVRLSRLIDSVLDFARIERGADVYEFTEEQDLAVVVDRALELSHHRLERAKMELSCDFEPDLPAVRIDANAITVAVLNLVDNALKYAVSGAKLEVSLRRHDGGLLLEVRDYGPGVPDDERDAIFDRFYRSRVVRLKPIRGSGIGLALVRNIADAHDGRVWVDDAEGGGAAFRLWIPVGTKS